MGKYDRKSNRVGEPKIGEEAALVEFRKILDNFEAGIRETADEEAKKESEEQFDEIVLAIRWGEIEVEEDAQGFKVIQRLSNGQSLKYREPTPADAKALGRIPENKNTDALYALAGRLCGLGDDAIRSLKGQDKDNALRLSVVFMTACS
ncbi:hypothetical protein FACS189479_04490 [Spirochaetia bacterium]|nr:hypothetical protein FACS189479_04490 [Spirochaetia bacterium]